MMDPRMEPITHFLTGACIGRAGFNRKTACATIVATLAAEAADMDVFWGFAGPVEELKRHRGITHTLLGAPFVAAFVVAVVGGWYVWRERRRKRKISRPAVSEDPIPKHRRKPPLNWFWLSVTGLTAAFSHILLDWTNNYGVRPFFPFNPRWYEGSFMFIAEPVIWALLLAAFIMPWLLGLADREIGARRPLFRGRGWAIFALLGMLALGCWRWAEHGAGLILLQNSSIASQPIARATLEPYPINPWRWHAVAELPTYFQTAEINTRTGSVESDPRQDILYKPDQTAAIQAAKATELGQVYLDWGTWAVVRDVGQVPAPGAEAPKLPPGRSWTTVEFTDLRFAYAFRGGSSSQPPSGLSGWVYIIDNREDGGEFMGGREQK